MDLLCWIVSSCGRLFRITARTTIENEVMAMASGSRRARRIRAPCVTCGMSAYWTSRMWECDVCEDYFLCEDCHEGSLKDSDQMLPAPHQVHSREHHMSPDEILFVCDGCNSYPIWKQRWRCKVCVNFDLCDVCHGGLGAADMPPEHSQEHEVVAVPVIGVIYPRFSKPVDPQWSYRVFRDSSVSGSGFEWRKRKPLSEILSTNQMSAVEDNVINQTPANAKKETNGTISKLQKQISLRYRSLSFKEAPHTTQSQRMVGKKHKIFLSHAGAQKDFVEQLYEDLSKVHHFGIFFDKEDESLPKGKPFPPRIFDAASHCELAVVVISKEYFVRKWPMLELATFVEAQKTRPELKILPVFYRLSVEEFKKRQESFWETWSEMPSVSEDEMEKWKEAVRVICRTNGLEYDMRQGEVAFRGKIVETVWKRVKPNLVWDVTHVQGKGRMQGMIQDKIQASSNPSTFAPLRMGLYGMGGSGKTTMCMVIGNQMMQHYLGNVCLIEFGSTEVLQMRRKMLQSICRLDSSVLLTVDEGQALTLLKDHIPEQKVCLILDNVSEHHIFFEEARTLLNLPFESGSLILVTARSCIVLEKLKISKKATMKIPALSTVEANALFSQHAGCDTTSLTEDQKKLMESFVERCSFSVEGMAWKEYHPLALKVLGTRVGPHPEKWQNIRIDFKYYENEDWHPIFSILRSSYDALNLEYQRMFLDIALNGPITRPELEFDTEFELRWHMRFLYGETDESAPSEMVKVLHAKSLVEFYDAEDKVIYIHDLYREFATIEVEKKGLQHSRSCCLSRGSRRRRFVQEGRLRIENEAGSEIRIDVSSCTTCSEAEYISIRDCPNLSRVDVSSMQSLRMFYLHGGCPELTRVNLGRAVNLQLLVWKEFVGEYPDIANMEALEVLILVQDKATTPRALHGRLDFSRSSNLDTLLVDLPLNLRNLNQAVQLRLFGSGNCQHLERFDGLEALVKLERMFVRACLSLLEFPSLVNFPCLKELKIEGAAKLKEMHGFAKLTGLVWLSLEGAEELEELPGIEACTGLTFLDLSGTSIGDCSWISMMKDLDFIYLSGTKIRSVPDCSGLTKLSELWVEKCPALERVGSNVGIPQTFPDSLKCFSALNSRSLKAVPQFNFESALEYLCLSGTCVEDLSSVMYCKHLRKLYVRSCMKLLTLPDLSGSSEGLSIVSLVNSPFLDPNLVQLPRGSTKDAADEYADREVDQWQECENST